MVRSAKRVFGRCFASPENQEAPSVFETPASRGLLRMRSLSSYDAVELRRVRASKPVLVCFNQPRQHLKKSGLFGLAERGKRLRIETLAEPAGLVGAPLARRAEAELDRPLVPRGPLALQNAGLLHPRQDLDKIGQLHFQHGGKLALRHRLVVADRDEDGVFEWREF